MEIGDNGAGFDLPEDWLELARHGHLGLVGMRERTEAIGGTFEISSRPMLGTRIRVTVPLDEQTDSLENDTTVRIAKPMTIRVILVEDNPGLRKIMAGLLSACPEIRLIAETADGLKALALTCELSPDVLVSDLELPGLSGDEIVGKLNARGSPVRTLLMSAHTDRFYIQGLLECTGASYLVKDDAPLYLVELVGRVARGEAGWFGGKWGRKEEASRVGPYPGSSFLETDKTIS